MKMAVREMEPRTSQRAKGKAQNANGKATERTTMMQERRNLGERLLEYGARIIKLVESLPNTLVGRRVADQLLRSGTSAGANYEEAQGAESKDDFVHKLQIALKELWESNYWLRLLVKSGTISAERMDDLLDESNQLRAILSKSVATAKGKAKENAHDEP
jgi:four helix bundle protein